MSEQTVCAFEDLVAAINDRLDVLRNKYEFNKSFNKRRKNRKKGNGRGRGRGRGRNSEKQKNFNSERIASDCSQIKQSVDEFVSTADKKKWFFREFMRFYERLPAHLRSKYDAPILDEVEPQSESAVDFEALSAEISAKSELKLPPFEDLSSESAHYLHSPSLKKRKICRKSASGSGLASELCDNERQRQFVWAHYDEAASFYFCRYLLFSSLLISDHWRYANRESKRGRERERIFMAEYPTKAELERHLSVRSPDERISDKYWYQRYRLFSKYDEGIQLDIESWHSVTPEAIAVGIAQKCQCNVIVDAMCGVGGNSIAFAQYSDFVIAVDIDAQKIKMAQHNAKIYGVEHKIEFIVADFFEIAPMLKELRFIDAIFLSPPGGGQFYQRRLFDLKHLADDGSMNGLKLFRLCRQITPNIAYFLPKNTNYRQLQSLAQKGEKCQIDQNKLYGKVKAITAYYGNLCKKKQK